MQTPAGALEWAMPQSFATAPIDGSNPGAERESARAKTARAWSPREAARKEREGYLARLDSRAAFYVLVDLSSLADSADRRAAACMRAALLPSDWIATAKRRPSRKEPAAFERALLRCVEDFCKRGALGEAAGLKLVRALQKSTARLSHALREAGVAPCDWFAGVAWTDMPSAGPDEQLFFELELRPGAHQPAPLDERSLARALDRARAALDSELGGLALFERCAKAEPRAFGAAELLAAGEARALRAQIAQSPASAPAAPRL